jgi:hypothetical protein
MDRSKDINRVPTIELTDEEHAVLVAYVLDKLREEKFPHAPRLSPVRSALAKRNAASAAKPAVERPPPPEAPYAEQSRRPASAPMTGNQQSMGVERG